MRAAVLGLARGKQLGWRCELRCVARRAAGLAARDRGRWQRRQRRERPTKPKWQLAPANSSCERSVLVRTGSASGPWREQRCAAGLAKPRAGRGIALRGGAREEELGATVLAKPRAVRGGGGAEQVWRRVGTVVATRAGLASGERCANYAFGSYRSRSFFLVAAGRATGRDGRSAHSPPSAAATHSRFYFKLDSSDVSSGT
jgi:hypothetical protein